MTENERLKLVRETLGISQVEFANALGIRQPSLSSVEAGKVRVSNKVRDALMQKYGVNPEWLLKGVGNMFGPAPTKYTDPKDQIIALLEDQVRLLKSQIADKEKIIKHFEGKK